MNKTNDKTGILYVCPTPVGNLDDISPRIVAVLRSVDVVAAEDTRRAKKLLSALSISRPVVSYHQFNERSRADELIKRLEIGQSLALVSDAGTPAISDPGHLLVKQAIEQSIQVQALPGPSALILGLVLSGLNTERFVFEGFLPRKPSDRKKRLKELSTEQRTIVFYEAPHRVKDVLQDMSEAFSNREIAICREMTKLHEEVIRGSVEQVMRELADRDLKGEFTIVCQGAPTAKPDAISDQAIKLEVDKLIQDGHTFRDAVKLVASRYDINRRRVYEVSKNG